MLGKWIFDILIGPLEVFFEVVFLASMRVIGKPGISIMILSLIMNILLLPLYRRTDMIQEEAIETENRMKPYVDQIKKTFKGDERFMMLQTCYRQHGYKTTDALKGLTPLLLEIPFFMAAYHFLSGLDALKGTAFGPIADLGAPDSLLVIGTLTIHVLPVLMTVINLISSAIYTKGAPARTKLQLYMMAGLFLVLLYDSPSGLVFYWTLNNLFSLIKNMLIKTRKPMRTLSFFATPVSIAAAAACGIRFRSILIRTAAVVISLVVFNIPLLLCLRDRYRTKEKKQTPVTLTRRNHKNFVLGLIMMTVIIGLLIPSSVIHTSPEEFLSEDINLNPLETYVGHTFLLSIGVFLVWMLLFYVLANDKWKLKMEKGIWILCGIAVTDYMFFGTKYGTLSNNLIYDGDIQNSSAAILLNILVLAGVSVAIALIMKKKPGVFRMMAAATLTAMIFLSVYYVADSQKVVLSSAAREEDSGRGEFHLSRNGKNVVVLMLDQAIGAYVPYIFQEKPELQQKFQGFTYYPNTLSFGPKTNFGLPAVMGGYEYIPVEGNQRNHMSLQEKHEEALKVMPVLFDSNGFHVTVCDPTYAGYSEVPDLSVYDAYPSISKSITMGKYQRPNSGSVQSRQYNFFLYSIMKTSPLFLQPYLYDEGQYLHEKTVDQICYDGLRARGIPMAFERSYNVLTNLPSITAITEDGQNTFQMMCNEATHSRAMLQLPDYTLSEYVDNSEYDQEPSIRTDGEGNSITLASSDQLLYYHSDVATFLQLGKWLDYLRENGVYDNTRIILVSDHAFHVETTSAPVPFTEDFSVDLSSYNPLLMVKDFGASQWTTDDRLMSNADVPALAAQGLIDNPLNPFTGNELGSDYKNREKLYVIASRKWSVRENNGNMFLPDHWLQFMGGDVCDVENWQYAGFGTLPAELQGT